MNFWFCETCGKRLTDQDLEAGKARDKKLKGVYCADCATGISTQEMAIVTDAQIHERLQSEPPPPAIEPLKPRRESHRRIEPASSGPASRVHHKPAKAKSSAPLGWIAATALMGGLFAGMVVLRGSSATPPKVSTTATSVSPAPVATAAPAPPSIVSAPTTPAPVATTTLATPIVPALPAAPIVPDVPPATPVSVAPAAAPKVLVEDEPEPPKKADPLPVSPVVPVVAVVSKTPVVAPIVPAGAVKSVQFRTGDDNYSGLVDVSITNSMQANYNKFNGVSMRSTTKSTELGYFWCVKAFAKDTSETQVLLAFKQISVPKGAKLVGAQLSVTFDNFWGGGAVGRYLNVAWDPVGLEKNEFGWLNRTPKDKWTSATGGADGNVLPGLTIPMGAISDGTGITKVVDLDLGVVKRWLDDPATNCGILMTAEKTGSRIKIHNSTDAKPEMRPMLILKYQ